MDIDIVNTILRLCIEQQTCLFEVSFLYNYCFERQLCKNSKYIIASIKNYMEIFQISRDQNRIEFFMPFEICRTLWTDGYCQNKDRTCTNLHLCYDYFYGNSCQQVNNCPYSHLITKKEHEDILGSLINLDLDALTKAFRVYCQTKKYSVNHSISREQQAMWNVPTNNNSTPSSLSSMNTWRMTTKPQINGNSSWKINNRLVAPSKTLLKQAIVSQNSNQGLEICWQPDKDIQTHFIEVIFSNENKSNGGPMLTHKIYQHLGIAHVFYQNSEIADRVALHGSVTFQSFTFTPRLLHQINDMRHICFSNILPGSKRIASYIDTVSVPYKKNHFTYYQNDQQIIVVEYKEDIDFSKILSNVRNHPECDGSMINCIQLYLPETLFIEYNDQDYSEDEIRKLFDNIKIFHIKSYSYCSFVHFYSHDDLMQSLKKTFNNSIQITPIYTSIYSLQHLHNYLQQRQMEQQTSFSTNMIISEEPPPASIQKNDSPVKSQLSIPMLTPPPNLDQKPEVFIEQKPSNQEERHSIASSARQSIATYELTESEDDFHDLPSDFDDDDLLLDEHMDNNGDMEFLRSAAKNLMSSLAEMEGASSNTDTIDTPRSLLYADDFLITINCRRFALAFLDYTQFRVEKQSNSDRYRLLVSLRKQSNHKQRSNHVQQCAQSSSATTLETKSKKKRNKRNKKKKTQANNPDEDDDDDDDTQLTI
ncbi:hypothetical protein I4U23_025443 [Adineta vaga]|nr:hypothetical protein I4U23_025443 [Adineta vaga]